MAWAAIIDLIVKLVGDWIKSLLDKNVKKMGGGPSADTELSTRELLKNTHDSLPWRKILKRAAIRRYMDLVPPVVAGKVKLNKSQKDEIKELGSFAQEE